MCSNLGGFALMLAEAEIEPVVVKRCRRKEEANTSDGNGGVETLCNHGLQESVGADSNTESESESVQSIPA